MDKHGKLFVTKQTNKGANLCLKCTEMRLAAGLCPNPLGELMHSPTTPNRNGGLLLREGKKGREGGLLLRGAERREGRREGMER